MHEVRFIFPYRRPTQTSRPEGDPKQAAISGSRCFVIPPDLWRQISTDVERKKNGVCSCVQVSDDKEEMAREGREAADRSRREKQRDRSMLDKPRIL